jgi:hypothetical protein
LRELVALSRGAQGFRNASLFNKKPPVVDSTIAATFNNSNTFPSLYDIQGRRLFVSGAIKC